MNVIDNILSEWSFRCDDGIVDYNNPKKKKILLQILKEQNLSSDMNIEEEMQTKYDDVLNKEFEDNIPKAEGKYILGKTTNVDSKDLQNYKKLYDVTPPKIGKDIDTAGSKGSGNGEIAIYWLFKYQNNPINVNDTRGRGAPDLNIEGKGVEIKAYDTPKMSLGRVGADHENVSLLNTIFGLHSLVTTINRDEKIEKQHSSLNFTKSGIVQALKSFEDFHNNKELRELSKKYPIIKNIYYKVDEILNIIGNENLSSPEDAASSMIKRLLKKKLSEKPGFGGYILNVSENGNLKWNQITEEKVDNLPTDDVINNVFLNQGTIIMNSDKLFG